MALNAAAAAAMLVVTAMRAMSPGEAAIVLPGLNPNHPNHRTSAPIVADVMLWPGMGLIRPSLPNLPMRGPRRITPARAAQPPTEWTTVEPAKSHMPSLARKPPPQIQWPVIGYMRPTMTKLKTMKAWNLIRSATAPETIVAAVPAKTSWKKNLAQIGTPVQLIAE